MGTDFLNIVMAGSGSGSLWQGFAGCCVPCLLQFSTPSPKWGWSVNGVHVVQAGIAVSKTGFNSMLYCLPSLKILAFWIWSACSECRPCSVPQLRAAFFFIVGDLHGVGFSFQPLWVKRCDVGIWSSDLSIGKDKMNERISAELWETLEIPYFHDISKSHFLIFCYLNRNTLGLL